MSLSRVMLLCTSVCMWRAVLRDGCDVGFELHCVHSQSEPASRFLESVYTCTHTCRPLEV
jgi:hypothetical protein